MEEQVLLIVSDSVISRVEADNSLDKLYEINVHSPGDSEWMSATHAVDRKPFPHPELPHDNGLLYGHALLVRLAAVNDSLHNSRD